MRRVRTHFEQVPLETVRKTAGKFENEPDQKEIKPPNVMVEKRATKTEPYSVTTFVYCRNRA
jgi:hypothetical protein